MKNQGIHNCKGWGETKILFQRDLLLIVSKGTSHNREEMITEEA